MPHRQDWTGNLQIITIINVGIGIQVQSRICAITWASILNAIHFSYGGTSLREHPTVSFFDYYFLNPYLKRISKVRPSNLIPFSKGNAVKEIEEKLATSDIQENMANLTLPVSFKIFT